ncbi:conserved hypothetical protein [Parafrankia sp. Ea1.12]|uniref:flavin-containing monooxygenase n=1 Tax=Parafrankia sp. Ea1.12 TaxID=573499 RepID=UPI000DA464EF|nr:NAD(P)-binding domain-containing protein [Parafrankia sp. Ea1.12]SQD97617.1 conserved hypothetical protein [Parafrankia sp. Ea1.12]
MPSVAIVGAGLAGLATAKAAREYDLVPTVFESAPEAGGLWRPRTGSVWPELTTNISRFTCSLSDYPWPAGTPEFPRSAAVAEYLKSYARDFDADRAIRFGCRVTGVERVSGRWRVAFSEGGCARAEVFDALVVATGFFGRPVFPRVSGGFDGLSIHSGAYRGPAEFRGRRVVVVGMAFSGAEIAAELARDGAAVTAVTPRPFWLVPRRIPLGGGRRVPLDLYGNTRSARLGPPGAVAPPPAERYRRRNQMLSAIGMNPGEIDEALRLDPDSTDPPHVVVSDTVGTEVVEGRLRVVAGRVRRLERSAVVLDDGRRVDADAVIWCTGYRPDLTFLPRTVSRAVEYDPTDIFQPVLLADAVFPQEIPGLSFVGMYRGPYFGVVELQARWVCAVMASAVPSPAPLERARGVGTARETRLARPRPQFPHNDLEQADRIGRILGVLPEPESARDEKNWFWDAPVIPAHYRMMGAHAAPTVARVLIEEARARCQDAHENQEGCGTCQT